MQNNRKRNFDAEAPTWDRNPERVRLGAAIADGILQQARLTPDMDVLDYGCGTGLITLALHPHVHSVTAADSSQGMLDVLAQKAEDAGISNVTTLLLNLDADDPPNDRFHAIVCTMTLHHIEDTSRLLRQFASMLHPGGYLCVADLDTENGLFHTDPADVHHFGFNREQLAELLTSSGFEGIKAITVYTVTKPIADQNPGQFPVFLMTSQKGAAPCP